MGLVSHLMSQTTSPPTGTQAIDRAAELLVRLIESDQAWSTMDLADEVRLPKSTASRLLRALDRSRADFREPALRLEQEAEERELRDGRAEQQMLG